MYFFQGKKYRIPLQGENVEWHWRMNILLSFPLSNLPPCPLSPKLPVGPVEIVFATTFQFKLFLSAILRHPCSVSYTNILFLESAPANLVSDSKTYKHAHIYGYTHFLDTQTYKYDMSMICCLSSPYRYFQVIWVCLGEWEIVLLTLESSSGKYNVFHNWILSN